VQVGQALPTFLSEKLRRGGPLPYVTPVVDNRSADRNAPSFYPKDASSTFSPPSDYLLYGSYAEACSGPLFSLRHCCSSFAEFELDVLGHDPVIPPVRSGFLRFNHTPSPKDVVI